MNIAGVTPSISPYTSTAQRLAGGGASASGLQGQLSQEDLAQLAQLKQRDREVRQHEQAHQTAAGWLATSSASFTYQKGPDGVNYAVGGEVGIDTSPGRTPEETISRAQTIRAAALAPADPSGQDHAVAAKASQMESQARIALTQQSQENASPEAQKVSMAQAKISSYYSSTEPRSSAISAFA